MADFIKKHSKLVLMIYGVLMGVLVLVALFYSSNISNVHVAYTVGSTGNVSIDSDSEFFSTGVFNDTLFEYFYKSSDKNSPFYNENIVYKYEYQQVQNKVSESNPKYREVTEDEVFDANLEYFKRKYTKVEAADLVEGFEKNKTYCYLLEGKYVTVDQDKENYDASKTYYTFVYEKAPITEFVVGDTTVYYIYDIEEFDENTDYYVESYKAVEATKFADLTKNYDDKYRYYTKDGDSYKEVQQSTITDGISGNRDLTETYYELEYKIVHKKGSETVITGFADDVTYYKYIKTDAVISSEFKSSNPDYKLVSPQKYDEVELHIKEYGVDNVSIADMVRNYQLEVSSFNTFIIVYAIIGLICFAIMLIFSNHNRRVYYKSNLYVGILMPLVVIIFTIIAFIRNIGVLGTFSANKDLFRIVSFLQDPLVDVPTKISSFSDYSVITNSSSRFNGAGFYVAMAAFIIVAIYSVLLIVYSVYRYKDSTKRRNDIMERAANKND